MLPAPADARDVARILRRVALARVGGPPSQGSMCLAVRASDGAILLVKPSYRRTWGLPGGFLEPGEDPVVGGTRELREETSATLHDPRLIVRWKRRYHTDHLIAGVITNTPVATSWEIRETRWLALEQATPDDCDLPLITRTMFRAIPGGLTAFLAGVVAAYDATTS